MCGDDCDADRATNNMALAERTLNGELGLVILHNGATATVLAFVVVGGVIKNNLAFWTSDQLGGGTRS